MGDFETFARWHVFSGDIDPVYPVLGQLARDICGSEDEFVSLILLYVAYYDLGSAVTTWLEGWRPGMELTPFQLRYPTGTERRAHRSEKQFAEHIAALGKWHTRAGSWPQMLRVGSWDLLQHRLQLIHGNGRWAAYKTGEMLKTVAKWPYEIPDAGHAFSSGPRKGLADVFPHTKVYTDNDPATIAVLDHYTDRLTGTLGLPVEQVETVLCDWHSLVGGRYYVGHDIDLMLEQTRRASREARSRIMFARQTAFASDWLGEENGWPGVRKFLNGLYREQKLIEWWER